MAEETMGRDARRWTVHLVVTALVMQSGSAAMQPRPAILGVAPESSRIPGPDQHDPLSVPLDTIEDHPDPFLGRDVSVEAEVEEVLGPRAFIIDEPDWVDFDKELLVIVPSEGLAIVREDDRITVTGLLLSAAEAALDEESPQITLDRRDDMADRPVIIAARIDVYERKQPWRPGTPLHRFRHGLEAAAPETTIPLVMPGVQQFATRLTQALTAEVREAGALRKELR